MYCFITTLPVALLLST